VKKIKDTIIAVLVLIAVVFLTWQSYQIGNRRYVALRDSIAVLVPDTVHHWDTIHPVDSINWIDSTVLNYVTIYDTAYHDSIRYYSDSIVNDYLTLHFMEKVNGVLLDRNVGYRLKVPLVIHDSVTIHEPYPVIKEGEKQTGLYYGFGVGFAKEGFGVSAGIDLLTDKNIMYGIGILKTEQRGYVMANVKFKF